MKNIKTISIALILTLGFIYACFYSLEKGLARQDAYFQGCTTDASCVELTK